MEFTRFKYDNCNEMQQNNLNTHLYSYVTDPSYHINNNTCEANLGYFSPIIRKMPVSKMIDFENDITGRNKKLSCDSNSTLPCWNLKTPSGNYCDNKGQKYLLNMCPRK